MRLNRLNRDKGLRPMLKHGPEARVTLKRSGFLLIESMIASVILAVAAMGIVSLLLTAKQEQTALQQNSTAVLLAKQLMEEIIAKPFGSSTPVVARSLITSANQYNGYQDSTAAMSALSGVSVTPGDGEVFSRQVAITNALTPTGSGAPVSDLQLVTVTVTTPSQQTVTLSRLLTNVTWP